MSLRTEISFSLVCSNCGNVLSASEEQRENKNMYETGSAYKAKMNMKIDPCEFCIEKALQPVKTMSEIIKEIDKVCKDFKVHEQKFINMG